MRARFTAHPHPHGGTGEERYAEGLDLLNGITPYVQAFPPDAVRLARTSAPSNSREVQRIAAVAG